MTATILLSVLLSGSPFIVPPPGVSSSSQIHLNDDVKFSQGNTAAAPDCWWEWDTAATPDNYRLTCTNVDGAGTDGIVIYVNEGTDDLVCPGTLKAAGFDVVEGNITNAGDIQLDSLTADATSGGVSMGGTGAVSAERLLWQFGEADNICAVSSTTGITTINYGTISQELANSDVEGTMSVGDGSALSALYTAILDRDFSSATTGAQLYVDGIITASGGTSDIYAAHIKPGGITLNDGGPGTHALLASLAIEEPQITETVGTCTSGASLYVKNAPTECDANKNFAAWFDSGNVQVDDSFICGTASVLGTDFTYAKALISQADSGLTATNQNIGMVSESAADGTNTARGIMGLSKTSGARFAAGVQGQSGVNNTNDGGGAYGLYGYAAATHAGGDNIGVYGYAASGANNYCFHCGAGNIKLDSGTLINDSADGTVTMTNAAGSSEAVLDVSGIAVNQADLAVGSCTLGQISYDTAGTKEICFCTATNSWQCIDITTANGPKD